VLNVWLSGILMINGRQLNMPHGTVTNRIKYRKLVQNVTIFFKQQERTSTKLFDISNKEVGKSHFYLQVPQTAILLKRYDIL